MRTRRVGWRHGRSTRCTPSTCAQRERRAVHTRRQTIWYGSHSTSGCRSRGHARWPSSIGCARSERRVGGFSTARLRPQGLAGAPSRPTTWSRPAERANQIPGRHVDGGFSASEAMIPPSIRVLLVTLAAVHSSPMTQHSQTILELARRGAQHRYEELQRELGPLSVNFRI